MYPLYEGRDFDARLKIKYCQLFRRRYFVTVYVKYFFHTYIMNSKVTLSISVLDKIHNVILILEEGYMLYIIYIYVHVLTAGSTGPIVGDSLREADEVLRLR